MKKPELTRTAPAEGLVAPSPYQFLTPVRSLRRELGLTPNDLAVLTALVSFLPREGLRIVFPSNAALSERANGLDERTLRRSLARLTAAGLIARRNSANGKRFPLRKAGAIQDAFGFDLTPLIDAQERLMALARRRQIEGQTLHSLRSEALALRAALLSRADLSPAVRERLDSLRNILRRATLTLDIVHALIGEMQAALQSVEPSNAPETAMLSGKNGQTVRHTESEKKESDKTANVQRTSGLKRDPETMNWRDFTNIARFFPQPPRCSRDLSAVLADLGRLLRISQNCLTQGLQRAGAGKVLLILDYLIERSEDIRQPQAYFSRVVSS